jgi:hypothetical protein
MLMLRSMPKSSAYASRRWANAVAAAVLAPDDVRTVGGWARCAGTSRATLDTSCRSAGTTPKRSLDLARLLRAWLLTEGRLDQLDEMLDIADPRTVRRLLDRAGIQAPAECGHPDPSSLDDFLTCQHLVRNKAALGVLAALLDEQVHC